jgi:hypothetical protein
MTGRADHFDFHDDDSLRRFRAELADLEQRAQGLSRDARHDVTNSLGAARNAVILIEEGAQGAERERFVEIAKRNVRHADHLIRAMHADAGANAGAAPAEGPVGDSARDERNDFRRPGEDDHRDAIGF